VTYIKCDCGLKANLTLYKEREEYQAKINYKNWERQYIHCPVCNKLTHWLGAEIMVLDEPLEYMDSIEEQLKWRETIID
jgi:hypothetical protein